MRAAVIETFGIPYAGDFPDPEPTTGAVVLDVLAAGVHHLDLAKASGTFYTGPPPLPSVVGSDGVGRLGDGRLVYFDETIAPFGSMAERTLAREETLIPALEGVDPVILAALGNAGLAAFTALHWRAGLRAGETVVILGATGVVGRIAVQVARLLGAGRIIAAGLEPGALARAAELGAHATVRLDGEDLPSALAGADVILDLLWGEAAVAALTNASRGVRLIQVGHMASAIANIPAALVRSRAADIRGHAIFHAPLDVRADAYRRLGEAVLAGQLEVDVEAVPLSDVALAWERQAEGTGGVKLVIVP